jgi:hypothetical protein
VDVADDPRLGQDQQVVRAAQVVGVVAEAFAAEAGFIEFVVLDHRAHRAVQHEDPLADERGKTLDATEAAVVEVGGGGHRYREGSESAAPRVYKRAGGGRCVRATDHRPGLLVRATTLRPGCRGRRAVNSLPIDVVGHFGQPRRGAATKDA